MIEKVIAVPFIAQGERVWPASGSAQCAPPPAYCLNDFSVRVLDDMVERHVESELGRGVLKLAVDLGVPQLRAPACQWFAAATFIAWGFS